MSETDRLRAELLIRTYKDDRIVARCPKSVKLMLQKQHTVWKAKRENAHGSDGSFSSFILWKLLVRHD